MDEKSAPLIAFTGPTGSGKTVTIRALLGTFSPLERVVTSTTRKPRPGERDGVDYHFYDNKRFLEKFGKGEFVEKDHFAGKGNLYGIERAVVERIWKRKKVPIVAVTLAGIRALTEAYPKTLAVSLTVSDESEIVKRIRKHRKDTPQSVIDARLAEARIEFDTWKKYCKIAYVGETGGLEDQVEWMQTIVSHYLHREDYFD